MPNSLLSRDIPSPMFPLIIREEVCDYCGCCVGVCDADAIELRTSSIEIVEERCTLCLKCVHACPLEALRYHRVAGTERKP